MAQGFPPITHIMQHWSSAAFHSLSLASRPHIGCTFLRDSFKQAMSYQKCFSAPCRINVSVFHFKYMDRRRVHDFQVMQQRVVACGLNQRAGTSRALVNGHQTFRSPQVVFQDHFFPHWAAYKSDLRSRNQFNTQELHWLNFDSLNNKQARARFHRAAPELAKSFSLIHLSFGRLKS